ncbi:MAG: creatininase family protein, partial [Clostridia bacterium]|nr:creatininase family protein [Clostridia bacterium]
METRWLYRSSDNFAELRSESCGVCVIPMGCSEKHGLHLPVGTDIIAASDIAFKASQLETCCVFPDFTFGNITAASTHYSPDGSLVIPVKLQFELLEVLCDEISRNGFKKILVYNGHGGNT